MLKKNVAPKRQYQIVPDTCREDANLSPDGQSAQIHLDKGAGKGKKRQNTDIDEWRTLGNGAQGMAKLVEYDGDGDGGENEAEIHDRRRLGQNKGNGGFGDHSRMKKLN